MSSTYNKTDEENEKPMATNRMRHNRGFNPKYHHNTDTGLPSNNASVQSVDNQNDENCFGASS